MVTTLPVCYQPDATKLPCIAETYSLSADQIQWLRAALASLLQANDDSFNVQCLYQEWILRLGVQITVLAENTLQLNRDAALGKAQFGDTVWQSTAQLLSFAKKGQVFQGALVKSRGDVTALLEETLNKKSSKDTTRLSTCLALLLLGAQPCPESIAKLQQKSDDSVAAGVLSANNYLQQVLGAYAPMNPSTGTAPYNNGQTYAPNIGTTPQPASPNPQDQANSNLPWVIPESGTNSAQQANPPAANSVQTPQPYPYGAGAQNGSTPGFGNPPYGQQNMSVPTAPQSPAGNPGFFGPQESFNQGYGNVPYNQPSMGYQPASQAPAGTPNFFGNQNSFNSGYGNNSYSYNQPNMGYQPTPQTMYGASYGQNFSAPWSPTNSHVSTVLAG